MSIEEIGKIYPHTNADSLELVQVLGYQCVVAKGKYKTGDKIIYIQPDYVLPDTDYFTEYKKYAPKRVRAIKIRKEWSEGIILPLSDFGLANQDLSTDVKEQLNIVKYSQDPERKGKAHIPLPWHIPKTDEERWENMKTIPYGDVVDVTLKIDGQSWSMFYKVDTSDFGIMSRSIVYNENDLNLYTDHLKRYPTLKQDFIDICIKHNRSLCVRGESYGTGIQNLSHNKHCQMANALKIFSVYDMDNHKYLGKGDPLYFKNLFPNMAIDMLEENVVLTRGLIDKYSLTEFKYEGVVIKGKDYSFKVINKLYDSKK
jgi:RNA ligase (TIGR02306 family)